jgi:hypothetical protein
VGGRLLQSHVSSLGEEEIDCEQFDEDPYIVHDVVCENLLVKDSSLALSIGKLTFPLDGVQRNWVCVLVEDQCSGDEEVVQD